VRVYLVDKEVEPLELLGLKQVVMLLQGQGHIQAEKLPEPSDEEQGEK